MLYETYETYSSHSQVFEHSLYLQYIQKQPKNALFLKGCKGTNKKQYVKEQFCDD